MAWDQYILFFQEIWLLKCHFEDPMTGCTAHNVQPLTIMMCNVQLLYIHDVHLSCHTSSTTQKKKDTWIWGPHAYPLHTWGGGGRWTSHGCVYKQTTHLPLLLSLQHHHSLSWCLYDVTMLMPLWCHTKVSHSGELLYANYLAAIFLMII